MELTREAMGAYTYFRANGILKGQVQTEPGQDGTHFVALFMPDVATHLIPAAQTFEDGAAMVTAHAEAHEVRTWADGFGVWHASVPLSSKAADRAQRAIVAELEQREGPGFDPSTVRVYRVRVEGTHAVYVERAEND